MRYVSVRFNSMLLTYLLLRAWVAMQIAKRWLVAFFGVFKGVDS